MSKLHGQGPTGRDDQKRRQDSIATSLEDLGDFCLASGEFATAIEYFNKLLALTKSSETLKPRRASLLRRLATCYEKIGKFDHALELLDRSFMLVSDGEDLVELARVIEERARVHYKRGEYDLSKADCESALEILLTEERGKEIAATYRCLGLIYMRKGQTDRALDFLRSGLSIARIIDDRELLGTFLNNLGLVCKNLGQWSEAQSYLEEALRIADEIGQHLEKGIYLINLGIVYSKRGLWKKAYRCWIEALETLAGIGNRYEVVSVYLALGQYHLTFRDFERAQEYCIRAMKESSENGYARGSALSFEYMGDVDFACDRLDAAHRCYLRSLEIAEEIAPEGDIVAEVKARLADVETKRGNYEAAVELASEALRVASSIKDVFEQARALRARACAEFHRGEWERARADFAKAANLLTSLGEKKELAITYLRFGRLLSSQRSSYDVAVNYLSDALSNFVELDMSYEASIAALTLSRIAAMLGDVGKCRKLLSRVKQIFDGNVPAELLDEIGEIESEADERVSCLSVSEANDLASFNAVVGRILSADGQAEKLGLALSACIGETPGERGLILFKHNGEAKLLARKNIDAGEERSLVAAVVEMMDLAAASKRPLVSTNAYRDKRLARDDMAESLEGAVMCVPIVMGDDSVGCIYMDTNGEDKFFSKSDVEFVVALAGVAKSIVSETKLHKFMEETRLLRSKLESKGGFQGIITQNRRMTEILESVKFLTKTLATVLLEGETGTGKEMLARAIHLSGDRQDKPFVTIDCSALSNEVLESELFGHVKGAFTDAKMNKAGLFEAAEGGTVFLDEIDKTSRKFQERLLQVVDKREFKPVGSTTSRKVDFRLICATNRDLTKEVQQGRFLEDLYYRLKVISLRLPPLRERRDDIPLLSEHFLRQYASELGKTVAGLSPSAMDLLVSFSWPGNVRQLQHEIERAVTFSEDGQAITPSFFSDDLRDWGTIVGTDEVKKPMAEAVEQIERQMIKSALRRFNGNKTKAARSLGLSRRGLLNKVQRYGIES